jgi:hypothetical protein
LFIEDLKKPEGLVAFCSYSDNPITQKICINAVMNILTVLFVVENNESLDTLTPYCVALPGEKQDQCFANAATRLIQIDPRYEELAIRICNVATERGVGAQCFEDMMSYSTYSFHEGSQELQNYCGKFPDPWRKRCLDGSITPFY